MAEAQTTRQNNFGGKFNPQKFAENMFKILALVVQLAPLFAEDAQAGGFNAGDPGGEDPAALEAELSAALDEHNANQATTAGRFKGPATQAALAALFRRLIALAESNVEAAAEIADRLAEKISPFPLP